MYILSQTANWRLLGATGILTSADLYYAFFSKLLKVSTGSIIKKHIFMWVSSLQFLKQNPWLIAKYFS